MGAVLHALWDKSQIHFFQICSYIVMDYTSAFAVGVPFYLVFQHALGGINYLLGHTIYEKGKLCNKGVLGCLASIICHVFATLTTSFVICLVIHVRCLTHVVN